MISSQMRTEQMRTDNDLVQEYRRIRQDYAWDSSIFCKDAERVSRIKEIIDTRLSVVDKTLILLYVDCLSYRKLGEKLHLSHMTIGKEIKRIKRIILEEYESIH